MPDEFDEMVGEAEEELEEEKKPKSKKKGKKKKKKRKLTKKEEDSAKKQLQLQEQKLMDELSAVHQALDGEELAEQFDSEDPRMGSDDEGVQGRRRDRIWKRREAMGFGSGRRPIYDKDGEETGATTYGK